MLSWVNNIRCMDLFIDLKFNELRNKILKHYEIVKKEFSKWKDILYDA